MGVQILSASSQTITNSSILLTGRPFIMGCWFYPYTASAANQFLSIGDNTITNSTATLAASTTTFNLNILVAGVSTSIIGNTTVVTNAWFFVMMRWTASNNSVWIIVYNPATGRVDQVSGAPGASFTQNEIRIGGQARSSAVTQFGNGVIAEAFFMDSDVIGNASATALDPGWVRQLALEGPFARPDIAANIVEYRSFLQGAEQSPQQDGYSTGLTYQRSQIQTWTNAGGPLAVANHPPLLPNYIRPGQIQTILTV